jgi:luciferase family oxidoreductase group 1
LDAYPDQLLDLYGYLSNTLPESHPYARVKANPDVSTMPELWVLGSSDASAQYAAELGWSFCFAHFINPLGGAEAMRLYREEFQPSPFLAEPRGMVAVSATCAPTTEEAERLSWSRWCWRIAGPRGALHGIPSPEEAMAFDYTPAERDYIDFMRGNSIYGDRDRVVERLSALAHEFETDEVMVVTITYDFAARVQSYELLASATG